MIHYSVFFKANIGIIHANPSTDEGVTEIIKHLQQYTARISLADDSITPFVIPCHADGLSNERMVQAQRNRAAHPDVLKRLWGLEAVPQIFHNK